MYGPEDLNQMPSKPEWIDRCRRVANDNMEVKPGEAVKVMRALDAYRRSDELGGKAGAGVLLHLGGLRRALGVERLPLRVETHGWLLVTF